MRKQREKALLVAHNDGFVAVYGERYLDIHIAQMLPTNGGIAAELLAEQHLEDSLPPPYRKLFWPGMVRATTAVHPTTLQAEADRLWQLEFIRKCDEISSQFSQQDSLPKRAEPSVNGSPIEPKPRRARRWIV